ncbi:hypothetical protein BDZ89DRAFT_1040515 [Hymenopellis radicata]|nr:hypothetical protein BDZ89DRAFT_1040515 [Hymenopellis radicata]
MDGRGSAAVCLPSVILQNGVNVYFWGLTFRDMLMAGMETRTACCYRPPAAHSSIHAVPAMSFIAWPGQDLSRRGDNVTSASIRGQCNLTVKLLPISTVRIEKVFGCCVLFLDPSMKNFMQLAGVLRLRRPDSAPSCPSCAAERAGRASAFLPITWSILHTVSGLAWQLSRGYNYLSYMLLSTDSGDLLVVSTSTLPIPPIHSLPCPLRAGKIAGGRMRSLLPLLLVRFQPGYAFEDDIMQASFFLVSPPGQYAVEWLAYYTECDFQQHDDDE